MIVRLLSDRSSDELYAESDSWETVIAKAFSTNSGMDACLGLYDDYYESGGAVSKLKARPFSLSNTKRRGSERSAALFFGLSDQFSTFGSVYQVFITLSSIVCFIVTFDSYRFAMNSEPTVNLFSRILLCQRGSIFSPSTL